MWLKMDPNRRDFKKFNFPKYLKHLKALFSSWMSRSVLLRNIIYLYTKILLTYMRFIFIFRLLLASSSLFFKLFKSIIYFLFIVLFIFLFLCVRIQGGFDSHLINLIYDLQLLPKNRRTKKGKRKIIFDIVENFS